MPYMALSPAATRLRRLLDDLPLPDERLPEAEGLIKQCSEAELVALGLGPPPRPAVPRILHDSGAAASKDGKGVPAAGAASPQQRLHTVQQVINSLQYNHAPGYFYNVSKSRPFSRVMETAREVLRAALPIKCLEAVFLGALLTAGWHDLDRLPLAFKSSVQGQTYRHIVLVVCHAPSRKWGALGLSRRPELMDKDLAYDSLADLVSDYKAAYERWWHTLVRVYVGLPLEHDTHYPGPVCWRYLTLSLTGRKSWSAHRTALDAFAGQARRLAAKFRALGVIPSRSGGGGNSEAAAPQAPGQSGAGAHGGELHGRGASAAAAGAPAGLAAAGPGGGAAAGAARYAKSVSPSRRRQPLPQQLLSSTMPLSRRPVTPTRLRTAAVAMPGGAASVVGVGSRSHGGSPAAAGSLPRPAADGAGGRVGSSGAGGSPGGAERGGAADVAGKGGLPDGLPAPIKCADGGCSPGVPKGGNEEAPAPDGGVTAPNSNAGPCAALTSAASPACGGTRSRRKGESAAAAAAAEGPGVQGDSGDAAAAAAAENVSGRRATTASDGTAGAGSGAAARPADRGRASPAAVGARGNSGRVHAAQPPPGPRSRPAGASRPRRASDPGGGAAVLAAAAAAAAAARRAYANPSCKGQARRLRRQIQAEERSGGAPVEVAGDPAVIAGKEGTVTGEGGGRKQGGRERPAGSRVGEEEAHGEEEEEESESDEEEYLSGGSESEVGH